MIDIRPPIKATNMKKHHALQHLLKRLQKQPKTLAPFVSLLLILIVTALITPGFLEIKFVNGHLYGSLIDILHRGTPTALVALGMAVVIGTRGIDLSVGAVIAISGAVTAVLTVNTDWPVWIVIACALGSGLVCGLWNGLLVSIFNIQPIVATLILMVAGRGIAQMITEGQIVTFHSTVLNAIGNEFFLAFPIRVWIALGMIILTIVVMRKTSLGLFIEAVGANVRASRLVGIEARLLVLSAYMFSGFCAALSGIIIAADIRGADANNAGLWLELDAILAVVLAGASLAGGRIYLGLTIIGVLIIQTLTTAILTSGLPVQYNLVVKATIILAVLLIQSPTTRQWLSKRFQSKRRQNPKKGHNSTSSQNHGRADQ
ncbi:Inner membrane ABC transporter permease protein YtfT [Marinomonas spartinae]|uniref:ABC transporter permease n=1 Tax=Marinomonas spartinae TaxID=1792290 RepID=UPI000808C80E|nr:ABC transporter permease [Marinomonas spartinae]SBS28435.1 Inner membrane ABC transporter permease protein YtfT [Marinomonas spartinae]